MKNTAQFDMDHYHLINERRAAFLDRLLDGPLRGRTFKRTADLGCGFGYFANHLAQRGHKVEAYDGRKENVDECTQRYPSIPFRVWDIEDSLHKPEGTFDFTFCFGLIYHLENPFLAIRNLAAISGGIAVIETVIAGHTMPAAVLYDEPARGEAQALQFFALIPSEAALVKMLTAAGMTHVYRPTFLPDHPDFTPGAPKRRTVLLAARQEIASPELARLHDAPNYSVNLVPPATP